MNFLVTGGAGFIGSHLVDRLLRDGHQVRILDDFSTGKKENIAPFGSKVTLIEGDVRDLAVCREACSGVDFVFHEAALGSVPRSVEDPLTTNAVNVEGTLNMLVAARDAKVKRVVFASSSSIYGDSLELPKVEKMSPNPLSPYALSKLTGETYMKMFFNLYGLETIALRYFNVFGPRQDPLSEYAAVIPKFTSALVEGKSPIIYGDGLQTRDFSFIDDVVEANMLAIKAPRDVCGQTYNIAYNHSTTLNELFNLIREELAAEKPEVMKIAPKFEQARSGDIKHSIADFALAKEKLKFVPKFDVIRGLRETVAFFKGKAC